MRHAKFGEANPSTVKIRFQSLLGTVSSKIFLVGLPFIILMGEGCKSVSHYISPRIEGRVVNVISHEPIEGVEVRRLPAVDKHRNSQPPKGGQLMMETPVVRTDADGKFAVDSQSALGLFRKFGWYSVSLSFHRGAYEDFTTTYTVAQSTNSAEGEPLVRTKDVCLRPIVK
jgi:hypothetical protein